MLAKIHVRGNCNGIPAWLMTLSCTHLRWPELFQILERIQGNDLTDKQVSALSCYESCRMITLNPMLNTSSIELKHSSL